VMICVFWENKTSSIYWSKICVLSPSSPSIFFMFQLFTIISGDLWSSSIWK
jgi:hypothetical protein